MIEDEFDQLFDEAFEKSVKNQPDTHYDHRNAWKQVQSKMNVFLKRKRFNKMLLRLSVVTVSILIGAIIFGNPIVSKAFSPIYQSIISFPGEITSIFFGNKDENGSNKAKTDKPNSEPSTFISPEFVEGGNIKEVTVDPEEAGGKVDFMLPSFDYIPPGYELTNTEIFLSSKEQLSKEIRYTYTGLDHTTSKVSLHKLELDSTLGSGGSVSGTSITEVKLKHGIGYLFVERKNVKLEFLISNIHVLILGKLTKDEAINFAQNMKN